MNLTVNLAITPAKTKAAAKPQTKSMTISNLRLKSKKLRQSAITKARANVMAANAKEKPNASHPVMYGP